MNKTLGQIQHELEEAKEHKKYVTEALAHKEYSEEYSFEFKAGLTGQDFSHPGLKELTEGCNAALVHILPDLVAQLIEGEAFERMKNIVKTHVTGKSIPYLMNMKNDLERTMLKHQMESKDKRIAELEAELAKFEEMVKSYEAPVSEPVIDDSTVTHIKTGKKKK